MSVILTVVCLSVCQPTFIKVVDSDTISFNGSSYRPLNVDAPELRGQFIAETELAKASKVALCRLLQSGIVSVLPSGQDRDGRTLAYVEVDHRDVGAELIERDLAREWKKSWSGDTNRWCS